MNSDEESSLKEQIALLHAQLLTQQDILEAETRRRILLEDTLLQAGIRVGLDEDLKGR